MELSSSFAHADPDLAVEVVLVVGREVAADQAPGVVLVGEPSQWLAAQSFPFQPPCLRIARFSMIPQGRRVPVLISS